MTLYITPYRRLTNLRSAMDRLFEESFAETPSERELLLSVNVKAGDEDYTLSAFVPGLEAEDLDIEILNNTVTMRGEFKSEKTEDSKYLSCELPTGAFSRALTLPTALESSKAEANIKNGILTLRIPKAEAHRPKTIKVSAN
jgi:HSP20 family protein